MNEFFENSWFLQLFGLFKNCWYERRLKVSRAREGKIPKFFALFFVLLGSEPPKWPWLTLEAIFIMTPSNPTKVWYCAWITSSLYLRQFVEWFNVCSLWIAMSFGKIQYSISHIICVKENKLISYYWKRFTSNYSKEITIWITRTFGFVFVELFHWQLWHSNWNINKNDWNNSKPTHCSTPYWLCVWIESSSLFFEYIKINFNWTMLNFVLKKLFYLIKFRWKFTVIFHVSQVHIQCVLLSSFEKKREKKLWLVIHHSVCVSSWLVWMMNSNGGCRGRFYSHRLIHIYSMNSLYSSCCLQFVLICCLLRLWAPINHIHLVLNEKHIHSVTYDT